MSPAVPGRCPHVPLLSHVSLLQGREGPKGPPGEPGEKGELVGDPQPFTLAAMWVLPPSLCSMPCAGSIE